MLYLKKRMPQNLTVHWSHVHLPHWSQCAPPTLVSMCTSHTGLNVHLPHWSQCAPPTLVSMCTSHTGLNVHLPHWSQCAPPTLVSMCTSHTGLNVHLPHWSQCAPPTLISMCTSHTGLNVHLPPYQALVQHFSHCYTELRTSQDTFGILLNVIEYLHYTGELLFMFYRL